jgi:YggT family protein
VVTITRTSANGGLEQRNNAVAFTPLIGKAKAARRTADKRDKGRSMVFIGKLLILAIDIYIFIVIAQVVLQWLLRFEVISLRNPQAAQLISQIDRLVDPVYAKIRQYVPIPPIAGIDITPILFIFALHLLQMGVYQVMVG